MYQGLCPASSGHFISVCMNENDAKAAKTAHVYYFFVQFPTFFFSLLLVIFSKSKQTVLLQLSKKLPLVSHKEQTWTCCIKLMTYDQRRCVGKSDIKLQLLLVLHCCLLYGDKSWTKVWIIWKKYYFNWKKFICNFTPHTWGSYRW